MTITKQAKYLNGSDMGRTVTATVRSAYLRPWMVTGALVSVRHWSDRKTSLIVNTDRGPREGVLEFDATVTVTGVGA